MSPPQIRSSRQYSAECEQFSLKDVDFSRARLNHSATSVAKTIDSDVGLIIALISLPSRSTNEPLVFLKSRL